MLFSYYYNHSLILFQESHFREPMEAKQKKKLCLFSNNATPNISIKNESQLD